MRFTFGRTAGLDGVKAFLSQALSSDRFPHGLLLHGPEGQGQNALALDLADILLCESKEARPCGNCPPCRLGRSGNQERALFVLPIETTTKGQDSKELEPAQVEELGLKAARFKEDPYGYRPVQKDAIRIIQIRDLQTRLAYALGGGKSQVVLMPWCERMDAEPGNALLKTLEEPNPRTYFILTCAEKNRLLPTILSRCTCLALPPMDAAGLAAAAAAKPEWWDGKPPSRLLPFAEGSPGALLSLHRDGGEALLEEGARFLKAALASDWRSFSGYVASSAWCGEADQAARLLDFVLRMLRLFHRLESLEGPRPRPASPGGRWTAEALKRQGWDPSLAESLAPLEGLRDFPALAGFLEEARAAIQAYSKPEVALVGLYLEVEAKLASAESTV